MNIYCRFTAESVCKRILRSVKIVAKLQARKLTASRAQCVWALSCWKKKNSPDILSMARDSCC